MAKIIGVGIEHKNKVYHEDAPKRHHHVIKKIHEITKDADIDGEQGFVVFMNRKELFEYLKTDTIDLTIEQLEPIIKNNTVYSEDLW